MDIIKQLVDIYLNKETHYVHAKMSEEEAFKYYEIMFNRGNIIIWEEEGRVIGYVETWLLSFEQFGRMLCLDRFAATEENLQDGNIAYLASIYIEPEHRQGTVVKTLKAEWLRKHFKCEYFVGEARRKKHQPLKVFNRKNIHQLLEV